nr:uncharacterized protein LOC131782395 [Pocillopora verrucosa]
MAAVSVRNFRNFFSGKRTLVVLRTGFKSSIPCMAILNRPYCESSSQSVPDTLKERSPTIKRSPLFSGQNITPKRFQLSFEEFQQLRRKLRTKQKLAGLPIGVTFLLASSTITAYMFPNIFDATPEQIEPILGMDPIIFCGLCGVASAGVGFAAGTVAFKSVWKLFNKDLAQNMQEREADFLERVTARRASSNSKFEDDYYGESIKNVSDYRQWLREQQKKQNITDKYDNKEQSEELKTEAA